jgi:hypothetical protein
MALQTPRRTVAAATTRFPVLSNRPRAIGTIEFNQASSGGAATAGTTMTLTAAGATWTVNPWTGRMLYIAPYSSCTASAGAGTTLTSSGESWSVNQWAGPQLHTTGSGQVCTIASNTANTAPAAAMRALNPAFIQRNHMVEEALTAADALGDLAPFERRMQVLARPFEDKSNAPRHAQPPRAEVRVLASFCGT